jgi:hypothetical protein
MVRIHPRTQMLQGFRNEVGLFRLEVILSARGQSDAIDPMRTLANRAGFLLLTVSVGKR